MVITRRKFRSANYCTPSVSLTPLNSIVYRALCVLLLVFLCFHARIFRSHVRPGTKYPRRSDCLNIYIQAIQVRGFPLPLLSWPHDDSISRRLPTKRSFSFYACAPTRYTHFLIPSLPLFCHHNSGHRNSTLRKASH